MSVLQDIRGQRSQNSFSFSLILTTFEVVSKVVEHKLISLSINYILRNCFMTPPVLEIESVEWKAGIKLG